MALCYCNRNVMLRSLWARINIPVPFASYDLRDQAILKALPTAQSDQLSRGFGNYAAFSNYVPDGCRYLCQTSVGKPGRISRTIEQEVY